MEQPQTPPLQRHPSLQPFSRDHYVGLKQAQHMLKTAGSDLARRRATVAAFCEAWDREIDPHFTDEERLLLPLMGDAAAARLLREHIRLRDLAGRVHEESCRSDPDAQWMRTLGQSLNDHIRWEERELFPSIERSASTDKLREVGIETEMIERQRRPIKTNK